MPGCSYGKSLDVERWGRCMRAAHDQMTAGGWAAPYGWKYDQVRRKRAEKLYAGGFGK